MSALTIPNLTLRSTKGSPLTQAEADANTTNIKATLLALANLLAGSLNADGTLVSGSVGSNALQDAAVSLAKLNPALLYSLLPVDTDSGTQNAYKITARGGLNGSNIVPPGSLYDANGNFTLTGLTLNYGYFWTKLANDVSLIVNSETTLSANGAFTASATSVVLTGTPGDAVTATVAMSAPINAYKDGQIFFVYTPNASSGASTLNVNGLGAIPILSGGQPVSNQIQASSIFCVAYLSGSFVLFGGLGGLGGSGSSESSTTVYNYTGTTKFISNGNAVPGSGTTATIAHGLGVVPQSIDVRLVCVTDDAGIAAGQEVPAELFQISGAPAFVYSANSVDVFVTQGAGTPTIGGSAITPANWNLEVIATKTSAKTATVFPALNYSWRLPEGAYTFDGNLYLFYWSSSRSITIGQVVNTSNNEITQLTQPSAGNPNYQNANLFTRADGSYDFIFTSNAGVYRLPAVNPLDSIVPSGALYDPSGAYNLTVESGKTYSWVAGHNDISYSLDGGSTFITTVTFTGPAGGTVVLNGNANSSVTAQVKVTSSTWQPSRLCTTSYWNQKPQWLDEASGDISSVYVADSNWGGPGINDLRLFQILVSTGGVSQIGSNMDFTNVSISNIANFNFWNPAGNNERALLLQFNPLSRRIYLITENGGLLHIFKISDSYTWPAATGTQGTAGYIASGFPSWWADTSNRYSNLSYVKTIAVAGMGSNQGDIGECNYFVEVDQDTGLEKNIVFTRRGSDPNLPSGSVTVVPWVEG